MKNQITRILGFSLIELLVVIAIIACLAGVAVPVALGVRKKARLLKCGDNMRQVGLASMLYASDNGMILPASSHQRNKGVKSWTLTLQSYLSGTAAFECPCDENKERSYTYVINDFLTPNPAGAPEIDYSSLNKISHPGMMLLFAEAAPTYTNSDHFHFAEYRGLPIPPTVFADQVAVSGHDGKANYLFADGHVEALRCTETQTRLADQSKFFVDPTPRP